MMATKIDRPPTTKTRRISRPYYRNNHRDFGALLGSSFVVGCIMGATIALFVVGL